MTNEEAIAFLEQYINPEVYTEKCISAHAMGISALKQNRLINAEKMEPLTPEQLREMANKPYWHVGLREDSAAPHWSILDPLLAYRPEDYDYGTGWIAYAYPPTHIDREEWGCEYCTGHVDERPFLDSEDLYISGEGWLTSDGQDHDFCKIEFCPKCGRPLTPDAWDELEKRLRG